MVLAVTSDICFYLLQSGGFNYMVTETDKSLAANDSELVETDSRLVTEQLAPPEDNVTHEAEIIQLQAGFGASSMVAISSSLPLDQQPAAVYLASLRPSGRRTMQQALNVIAGLAS